MASLCVLKNGTVLSGLSQAECSIQDNNEGGTYYPEEFSYPEGGIGGAMFRLFDFGGPHSLTRSGNMEEYEADGYFGGGQGFLSSTYGMNDPLKQATIDYYNQRDARNAMAQRLNEEKGGNLFVDPARNEGLMADSLDDYVNQTPGTIFGNRAKKANEANMIANNALLSQPFIDTDPQSIREEETLASIANMQEQQKLTAEKQAAFLANEQDVLNMQRAQDAELAAEKETVGLPLNQLQYPYQGQVSPTDQTMFNNAAMERNLFANNFGDEDASFDEGFTYPMGIMDDGLFPGKTAQPTKSDYLINSELQNTVGSELVIEEEVDKEDNTVPQISKERWYEGFKDEANPDSMKNKIYNSIIETGADKLLDGIDDNSPEWLKNWGKGIVADLQNGDYLKAGGKLWVTKKGSSIALNTAWKLLKPGKKMLSGGNIVKVAVGAEVYEMAVNPEDGPILQQIQDKVDAIMKGPVGSSVATLVSSGNTTEKTNTENVENNNNNTESGQTTNNTDVLNSINASGSMNNIQGNVGINTTTEQPTNVFNVEESSPYSGNIGNMFTSLFNPSQADNDFWYKAREGDIPGNNRMREAMARLSYMGLYPEDRGTDPFQALTDDRVAYNNNQLDAQSSQSTLNATASNRQYNRWKDMLPSQSELAKQLIEDKALFFGKSKEAREAEAERAAGSLLRSFYGLMAKGVAPTPENLKVANELEKAGIDVNNSNVQYAIENGLLEELQKQNNEDNVDSSPSMLQQTTGFVNTVRNAFQ